MADLKLYEPTGNITLLNRVVDGEENFYSYGTDKMIEFLNGLEGEWFVGNISKESGGKIPYSSSHRTGHDVDIAIPIKGGGNSMTSNKIDPATGGDNAFKAVSKGEIDTAKSLELLKYAMKNGAKFVFLDGGLLKQIIDDHSEDDWVKKNIGKTKPKQTGLGIQAEANHADHFHIRLKGGKGGESSGDKPVLGPDQPGDPDSPSRKKAKRQFQMRAKRSRFRGDYPKSLPGVNTFNDYVKSIDKLVDAMSKNSEFRDYIVVYYLDLLTEPDKDGAPASHNIPDFSDVSVINWEEGNVSPLKDYSFNESDFKKFNSDLKKWKKDGKNAKISENTMAILYVLAELYNIPKEGVGARVKKYFDEIGGTPYMPDVPLEENKGNNKMRITKERLAQIIKEEVEAYKASQLNEVDVDELEEAEEYIKEIADLLKSTYETFFRGAAPAIGTPQTKANTGEPVTDQTAHEDAKGLLLDLLGDAIDEFQEKDSIQEDGHDDVPSAVRAMKTIAEDAMEMLQALEQMDGALPTWWTNKMAVSASMLNKMRDYLLVPSMEEEMDEQ